MRFFSMLTGPETSGLKNPGSSESAGLNASGDLRIVWFMGPRPSSWNGVGQHSLVFIRALNRSTGFNVEMVDIPAEPRSLKRYWWQFVLYPLHAIRVARSCEMVVLYQEDLSFLVPFVRLAGGRVCVLFHHVQRPGQARGVLERLKELYIRAIRGQVVRSNLVLVESEVTATEMREVVPVPPERVQIMPCPFEDKYSPLDEPTPRAARARARAILKERIGLEIGDAILLLNVGSDETRKNNVTLFRALARMARKDLVIVRAGKAFNLANRKECTTLVSESGIRAHFLDSVSDEDLGYLYQAADMYVSASLHEGFGRTVIEAQIAGIPVVGSDIQVYRTTMGDSFLPVSDPADPDAWAAAIDRLANDPALAERLVERGKINARQYSSEVVCASLRHSLLRAIGADAPDGRYTSAE
ncbi:glycosyltransferase family 4 protein [Paraburkholderia panacisoli]|uniref:Glycosyltransferase family 4 protein n=2 Tax=Paraburkholderia panacisoli TaxID=2603818 RepID=A0A5B0H6L5_9BURK|nr:glycosyltransferase family 4 protein [Paraburkholderia panacisoli]